MLEQRRKKILKFAHSYDCDYLLVFQPENLFYISGYWGKGIGLIEKNGRTIIFTPEMEVQRAKIESVNCDVIQSGERGTLSLEPVMNMIRDKKVCTDCQSYSMLELLHKSNSNLKAIEEPFHNARMVKDSVEISILKKISTVMDKIFDYCTEYIVAGMKESELQSLLMSYAFQNNLCDSGYNYTLNPLIVASGPNSSLPHAQVSNRKFRKGDVITVDLTFRYGGYISDATRTFGLGKISEKSKKIYEIVKESQKIGIKYCTPNTVCSSVDEACRKYIFNSGYGDYFVHSTGHGIGLEAHEFPSINSRSNVRLQKNMAITVEPGIYFPKKFGVRIEDSIIVGEKPIVLHKFTKDLIEI